MNRVALFACFFLVALSSGQDLQKKITIEIPAARASAVFAQLSKATGVEMEPAGNVQDDVFVVSAHDCTVDDVMRRIAQAEGGRWEQNGSLYLLVRDSSVSVLQERQELRARADLIEKAIAKISIGGKFDAAAAKKLAQETHDTLDQVAAGNGPGAARKVDFSGLGTKTPATRAIARLLATIDPLKLAEIAPGQRVVFSTNSTPVQKSLSGAGTAAFRDFVADQQLYTEAFTASEPQDPNNRKMVMMNGFGTPSMGNGNPQLGLGVGLVIVQRRFESGISVDIVAADPNLDTLATGSYTLQLQTAQEPAPGSAAGESRLEISGPAKEMAKALRGSEGAGNSKPVRVFAVSSSGGDGNFSFTTAGGGGGEKIKISSELRAKLLDPEHVDPLSFAPGEAMLALAAQTHHNLVALLPDYCFGSLTRDMATDMTPSQLLAKLLPVHGLQPKEDGNWLVIAPAMPYTARMNRVDRAALGALVRTLDKQQGLRLNDVAAFALAQEKTPGYNDADLVYPRLIDAPAADRMLMPLASGSYSLYRFYGSLSSSQRQAIAAGQQIPFTNLSSQQLALIGDMLYNSPQGPNVDLGQDNQRGGQQTKSVTATVFQQAGGGAPIFFAGGPSSAKSERTIVVPNGVNNSGYMLTGEAGQSMYQAINSRTGAMEFVDANTLGFQRGSANSPAFADAVQPQFDRYRPAKQVTISFKFMLNPRVMISRSLQDQWVDGNPEGVAYDQLPADFRKQVDDAAERMKNAFGKVSFGGGRQTAPPPQP